MVALLQQKPLWEQLQQKTCVSGRLLGGAGHGHGHGLSTVTWRGREGSPRAGPAAPAALTSTGAWGSATGVLGCGGEALGMHRQILLSFPSQRMVGWGSDGPWRGHSLCISGKVKGNSLFCFQLLAGF